MVLCHNIWSGGALPVVVTLFGWIILIRGVLILFLSPNAMVGLFEMFRFEEFFYVYVAIPLFLGLYLTYAGFKSSSPWPAAMMDSDRSSRS
jgi:amino acid permease